MPVTPQPMPTVTLSNPAVPDVPIYRLKVAQYEAMTAAGILTEDDRVELLEGWLVEKISKNPPHILPEPDAAVIRGVRRDCVARRPAAADIGLLVEVADPSLEQDRGIKQRAYARARIPVYWIVNLIDRQIEVYAEPTGRAAEPTYGQRRDYGPADTITLVLDGVEVGTPAVRDLLP